MNKNYFLVVLLSVCIPFKIFPNVIVEWLFGPSQQQKELMTALLVGEIQLVTSLLNRGINPNFIDPVTRNTPLGAVCTSTQMNTITKKRLIIVLIKHGANINMINGWKQSPLEIAEYNGNPDIIKAIKHLTQQV